jgi:hypothetical protein
MIGTSVFSDQMEFSVATAFKSSNAPQLTVGTVATRIRQQATESNIHCGISRSRPPGSSSTPHRHTARPFLVKAFVDRHSASVPRMPRVTDFSRFNIMGVALSTCITRTELILDYRRTHQQAVPQKFVPSVKARFNPFRDSAACTIVMQWQRRLKSHSSDDQTFFLLTRHRHGSRFLRAFSPVDESAFNLKPKSFRPSRKNSY